MIAQPLTKNTIAQSLRQNAIATTKSIYANIPNMI